MIVKQVDIEEWCKISTERVGESVYYERKFIRIFEKAFNVDAIAWLVFKGKTPILGLLAYRKGKSIVHPCIYTYSAIWEVGSAFDTQQSFVALIHCLQGKYKKIHLLLPPDIQDIRPFIRNRFRIGVNYTYLKDLTTLSFNSKLRSRDSRARSLGIEFLWNDYNLDIIEQHKRDFIKYGFGNQYTEELAEFFLEMIRQGYARGVSGRLDGKLIASGVVLVDFLKKNSLNCLISSEKMSYETGVNTALYIRLFNELRNEGITSNDLCGANALGGGNFKRNFSEDLAVYYEVKYSYSRALIQSLMIKLRKIFKYCRAML